MDGRQDERRFVKYVPPHQSVSDQEVVVFWMWWGEQRSQLKVAQSRTMNCPHSILAHMVGAGTPSMESVHGQGALAQ